MKRLKRWSVGGGSVALLLVLVIPARAAGVDGGITFHDIALNGGAGIHYSRTPSVTFAQRLALENTPLIPFATFAGIAPSTPQKDHGDPGVAIFDYDNDGYLDIYVTNGPGTPNSLFHNLLGKTGTLQFEDVGVQAGVAATEQDSTGVCVGDIDNDGWADLLVVGVNGSHNHLFHNNGDGTFSDITASAGDIAGTGRNSSSCTMGDFDGDGLLDIYVGNTYSDWSNRRPIFVSQDYDPQLQHNQLYMNRTTFSDDEEHHGGERDRSLTARDGQDGNHRRAHITFKDESVARGVTNYEGLNGLATYTWAVAAVDYDGDGKVDLLQADTQGGMTRVGVGYNRVLQNDGTGHFTDVTIERGLTQPGSWMGLSFGDYNCDGYLDFFSTTLGTFIGGPNNNSRWFLGSASKAFSDPGVGDVATGGLGGTPFGWGTSTLDYDNDGDQDIVWYGDDDLVQFWATDNPGTLLRNSGQCSAQFKWDGTGVLDRDNRLRQVQGVAVGDLNNDGFVDIVNAATFQFVPVLGPPTNRFLLFTTVFGPIFNTVFDSVAKIELVYRFVPASNAFTFIPTTMTNGDLSVEINSANNGNHWAKINLVGTKFLNVGRNNRDGAGALVRFTPDGGKTIIRPVIDGDSHASTSSRVVDVGLGSAVQGTVEVDWPGPNGPVRNKLYDVQASEKLTFPEIPCSYDVAGQRESDFRRCLSKALDKITDDDSRIIKGGDDKREAFRNRLERNMIRAFRASAH
jgi:hypothetical protein